jgi:transposase-like protein
MLTILSRSKRLPHRAINGIDVGIHRNSSTFLLTKMREALFQMFPDEETARLYLESRLWPKGVTCPTCAGQDRITPRKAGFHRCNKCQLDFTIRTGTIFERSHIPLHKWLYAMYLLVTARKGISSMQIAEEIGVQQKSAWFMLHRLREACGGEFRQAFDLREVDPIKPPKVLDKIVDVVLAYRPQEKQKSPRQRKKSTNTEESTKRESST